LLICLALPRSPAFGENETGTIGSISQITSLLESSGALCAMRHGPGGFQRLESFGFQIVIALVWSFPNRHRHNPIIKLSLASWLRLKIAIFGLIATVPHRNRSSRSSRVQPSVAH